MIGIHSCQPVARNPRNWNCAPCGEPNVHSPYPKKQCCHGNAAPPPKHRSGELCRDPQNLPALVQSFWFGQKPGATAFQAQRPCGHHRPYQEGVALSLGMLSMNKSQTPDSPLQYPGVCFSAKRGDPAFNAGRSVHVCCYVSL